ncbi:MAG: hypothetical protein WAO71_16085 [Gallionella sp.]
MHAICAHPRHIFGRIEIELNVSKALVARMQYGIYVMNVPPITFEEQVRHRRVDKLRASTRTPRKTVDAHALIHPTENTEFSGGMGIYNMRRVIDDIYHLGF